MALAIALTSVAITPGARTASAQAEAPRIEIQNLDKVPYNDRLVFNRIATSGLLSHSTVMLRIKNTGGAELQVSPLTISGPNAGAFQLSVAADRQAFTVAPGAQRDITVRFPRDRNDLTKGQRNAILTIATNDPASPVTQVQLAGFNMIRSQGDNEPTLQDIIESFGYTTNVTNPGENQQLNPNPDRAGACFVALGDEVISPNGRWSRADATKAVYVRQLASFSGSGASSIEISGGGMKAYHDEQNYHTYLPLGFDNKGNPGPVEMTLGLKADGSPASGLTNFSVSIKGYSSLRCATDPTTKTAVRFWAARDRSGTIIPNTYIVGGDIVGNSATNYDYQDNVYIITNIKPATGSNEVNTPAPEVGSPNLVLEFDKDTYPGTLTDNDGQRTGFPETQRNRNDITAPLSPPSTSYDKTKLNLNTAGQGTLTVRTTGGTNESTYNTQVNALCLPFDARDGRFVVTTRLVGPLNGLSSAQQMAGLLFGPSQGNFIRLTAGTQVAGQTAGKPWIQLAQELDNVHTQVGPLVSIPAPAAVNTLDLQLTADPATGEVEAAYAINGGALVPLAEKVLLPADAMGRFFDLRAKGCILASSRNTGAFDAVFDRFAIVEAPPAQGLPSVDAGPDLLVRTGAAVTLNGIATDANGGPLTGTWQQVAGAAQVTLGGSGNTRTFTAPNSYSVLTFAFSAKDAQNRSASDTVVVTVGEAPIRGLNISANTPVPLGTAVRLIASVTEGATPISYRWDFGDGTEPVTGGPVVTHTYTKIGTYNVAVTATNGVGTASTTLPVSVQTPVPDFAFRYDAGNNTKDITTNNVTWKSDKNLYSPTNSPSEARGGTTLEIANTTDDVLYRTYRGKDPAVPQGRITYNVQLNSQLGLPAGTLVRANLRLHFAEIYWGGAAGSPSQGGPGRRVFDIIVEGETLINNFDIYAVAGGADRAVIIPINGVEVTDGALTLALDASVDNAAISAFEILRAPDPTLENATPVVSAGANQTVTAGTPVTLSATGSDPEGEQLAFVWSQNETGAPQVTLGGSAATRTFTPTVPGTYSFTVSATDSGSQTGSDTVLIFVDPSQGPVNTPPTVSAGEDQTVTAGAPVTLTGSASDPQGDQLTLGWSQTGGPAVTLAGSGLTRSFTPDAVGTYVFAFTASDPGGLSASDSVTITVVAPENEPPTANAGADQTVAIGTPVSLTGSASDPENGQLTLSWSQTGGPAVTLAGSGATRTFTPSAAGSYVFTFTATDEGGLSASDSVTITVAAPENQAPTVSAGAEQKVTVNTPVTLTGSASDPDGDQLTLSWSQVANGAPSVTLGGSGASRTFTPTAAGAYIFAFTATDPGGLSATDTVAVNVTQSPPPVNQPPTANAGADRTVRVGTAVTLAGSGSDPEGKPLTFSWSQTSGPAVTLGGSGASRTFTPSAAGSYVFNLVATDEGGLVGVDSVTVTAVANVAPVANAGPDQSVQTGASVTLSGVASSDPQGDPITYSWQQIGGPAVTLQGASTVQPSFTAPGQAATLTFRLTVTDNGQLTGTDTVVITVLANQAPTARASAPASAQVGTSVALDGSASSDPESGPLSYSWQQVSGPAVTLQGANTARPSFTAPNQAATLVFRLTVTDSAGLSATAQVQVAIIAGPAPTGNKLYLPQLFR